MAESEYRDEKERERVYDRERKVGYKNFLENQMKVQRNSFN